MPGENNDAVRTAIDKFIALASEFVARLASSSPRRISTAELAAAAVDLARLCVTTLEAIGGMRGEQKKAAAMSAVEHLFDTLADRCVPTFARPVWWLLKPAVRAIYMAAMDGVIEQVLSMVRDTARQNTGNGGPA